MKKMNKMKQMTKRGVTLFGVGWGRGFLSFIFCLSSFAFCLPSSVFAQDVDLPFSGVAQEYTLTLRANDCEGDVYINVGDPAAIEEISLNRSVYPNPATDWLNIPLPEKETTVLLLDANGKLLQKTTLPDATLYALPFSAYPNGVYFVQLIASGKMTYKVIKK
jgi:hypothetical protein